ncbi:MAG: FxsA family protein [Spirochaetota bacterium]
MLTIDSLLRFLNPGSARTVLFWLLPVSALLLLDTYTVILASEQVGAYLTLAVSATISLVGVFVSLMSLRRHRRLLRRAVFLSAEPDRMYRNIAASFVAGLCFLGPGAVSAALGVVFLLPVFRCIPGYIVTRSVDEQLSQVYEYLKIENTERASAFAKPVIQENEPVPGVDRQSENSPGSGEPD